MISELKIRSAELKDISQISILMNSVFGDFPGVEDLFSNWIKDSNFSIFVAEKDKKIIGISTWHVKPKENLDKFKYFGQTAIEFMQNKKIAWILNLAIYPEFRKLGIGTQLSLSHREWLKYNNCDLLMGTSWESGSDDNSQHMYKKAGFHKISESRDFLKSQMQNGAICSTCKTSNCQCNSILFALDLRNSNFI